ncbi:exodeoxyribonuclease VII small subunit [Clostridiaceae bacterium M8S5]|nr:exodeoxyribonuclease VII small subunit [Clostridiaceae bacterium M8S5]
MSKQDMKFEDAYKKLSEITKELEDNNIDIDKSLEYFKEGVDLYKYCRDKLNDYEGKVKLILSQNENAIEEIDFTDGE